MHIMCIQQCIYLVQVQRYTDDPLIYHGALKARWGSEALSAIKEVRQNVHDIALPMLIFHGNDDQLVPFSASEFVFANVSSTNKTFEVCSKAYHKQYVPYAQTFSPGEKFHHFHHNIFIREYFSPVLGVSRSTLTLIVVVETSLSGFDVTTILVHGREYH